MLEFDKMPSSPPLTKKQRQLPAGRLPSLDRKGPFSVMGVRGLAFCTVSVPTSHHQERPRKGKSSVVGARPRRPRRIAPSEAGARRDSRPQARAPLLPGAREGT
jgi:hypothetical protein